MCEAFVCVRGMLNVCRCVSCLCVSECCVVCRGVLEWWLSLVCVRCGVIKKKEKEKTKSKTNSRSFIQCLKHPYTCPQCPSTLGTLNPHHQFQLSNQPTKIIRQNFTQIHITVMPHELDCAFVSRAISPCPSSTVYSHSHVHGHVNEK